MSGRELGDADTAAVGSTNGGIAGFRYNIPRQTYFVIQFPGSTRTTSTGINDSGTVVGSYTMRLSTHGYMFQP